MNYFFFGIYPYIAFTIFIIGTVLRYRFAPYGWTAQSSQILQGNHFRLVSNLFHISIIALVTTHIAGLLTPPWLYGTFITHQVKQLLAIFIGGFFGLLCLVATTLLIFRRLSNLRLRLNSKPIDIITMWLLYVILILGESSIYFSFQHLDGENLAQLAMWAQHLILFQPDAASLMESRQWIFKLHIFLGMTLFIVFPFSRLVHLLTIPIGYLFRSYKQIVRALRKVS